jgi:hypothetical protein
MRVGYRIVDPRSVVRDLPRRSAVRGQGGARELHGGGRNSYGRTFGARSREPAGYIFTIYVVQVNEVLKRPAPKSLWLYSENTTARYPMHLGVPNLFFITKTPTDNFVDNCGNSAPIKEAKGVYE